MATRVNLDRMHPTPRQADVLAVVLRLQAQGTSPSIRELAVALGIRSTNAVSGHLRELVRLGLLTMEANKSRSFRVPVGEGCCPACGRPNVVG